MSVTYTLTCEPSAHLYHIAMHLSVPRAAWVDLTLPVWTPGSYLIREYSRHLQGFQCALPWQKLNKNTWRIFLTPDTTEITVQYSVYAYDLSVRTSHLDGDHGYFNGACLFLGATHHRLSPHNVKIALPRPEWKITTSLIHQGEGIFRAETYDQLIDSPVEMGTQAVYSFMALQKEHQLAIWGRGNYVVVNLLQDITRIVETVGAMFGGLPYETYTFILHAADTYGGLEHQNSTTLLFPRFQFQPVEKYQHFLQLVAHEFFHTWNIKRLRPTTLDEFDYAQENYVSVLWFCEGATAYYDELICCRAQFYDDKRYLHLLSEAITRLETTPGKDMQSLTQSSFDAWIKLYRPDENSLNSSVSYYLKGHIVIWLLDLLIRTRTPYSFDTVFQKLWLTYQQSGGQAYTETELWETIEAVAGRDLTEFYTRYLQGTDPLPYTEILTPFGLQLNAQYDIHGYTGLRLGEDKPVIKVVERHSPAEHAGLAAGDELISIAGFRVTSKNYLELIKLSSAVIVTYFRRDELFTTTLNPSIPRPQRYSLSLLPNCTSEQQQRYYKWLGR